MLNGYFDKSLGLIKTCCKSNLKAEQKRAEVEIDESSNSVVHL